MRHARLRLLLGTTSLVGGMSLATLGAVVPAMADCVAIAGGFTCSGSATTTQSVDGTITTTPGFSVVTSTGHALTNASATGDFIYTDENNSTLTASAGDGIHVEKTGPATVSISTGGPVTGTDFGIFAETGDASGGAIAISVADVTGDGEGIAATNNGTGATTVISTGTVTANGRVIDVINQGSSTTDLVIQAVNVIGGPSSIGILVVNNGTGETTVKATGTVSAADGIDVWADTASTGVTIEVADVTATANNGRGIVALNRGVGSMTITATGTIDAHGGGIQALNEATAQDLTINVVDVTADRSGRTAISARNDGTGETTITSTGTLTGDQYGVVVVNSSAGGGITVNVADVIATNGIGIQSTNNGNGATLITATGTISAPGEGIYADNEGQATDITITVVGVSADGLGIDTYNGGVGSTHITATGLVTAGQAIYAYNDARSKDLTVDVADATGTSDEAIYATNEGTGSTTITATGTVSGVSRGVVASNGATAKDLTIDIASATASGNAGIGIEATNDGTGSTTINVGDAAGQFRGIAVSHNGSGDLVLTSSGSVSGLNDVTGIGILASTGSNAKSVSVDVNDVSGGLAGMRVTNAGVGSTYVRSTGTVTSAAGIGIAVENKATATTLDIDVVNVTGGSGVGIAVINSGTGLTTLTARGVVEGTSSGIRIFTGTTNIVIDGPEAEIRNGSGLSSAMAVLSGDAAGNTTVTNRATLTGAVSFGAGINTIDNEGKWNTAGATNVFAGSDTVTNRAGGRIFAAGNASATETTLFNGLSMFTNAGTFSLADGATGDGATIGASGDAVQVRFAAGSSYALDLDPAGTNADLLTVNGAVTIEAGATVKIANIASLQAGEQWRILTARDGVTGTFDDGYAFIDLTAETVGNDVYLTMNGIRAFTAAAATPNQYAVASAIPGSGALYDALMQLPDDAAAQRAFDLLSGEVHASVKSVLFADSVFVRDAAFGRLRGAFAPEFGASGMDVAPLAYASAVAGPAASFPIKAPKPAAAVASASAVWTQAFGSWGSTDSDGNASAMDRRSGGVLMGADTLVAGNWRLGAFGGYSRSSFSADAAASSGTSDNYHVGAYAGTQSGALGVRLGASYSWHDVETERSVQFQGFSNRLTASYDVATTQAFGEIGYRADIYDANLLNAGLGRLAFEPFAGVAYVSLRTDGFTESGGAAALSSAETTDDVTYTTLGMRAASTAQVGDAAITVRGMLGWRHAFGDVTPVSRLAFGGGETFAASGLPVAEDAAVVEGGLDVAITSGLTLGVAYAGQFGDGAREQSVRGSAAWRF